MTKMIGPLLVVFLSIGNLACSDDTQTPSKDSGVVDASTSDGALTDRGAKGDTLSKADSTVKADSSAKADAHAADQTITVGDASAARGFAGVYQKVLQKNNCGNGYCHGSSAGSLKISTEAATYAELMKTSASTLCAARKRVDPGDPQKSLLYLKLAGKQDCGVSMPRGGALISAAELKIVFDWITAGAKR